MSEKVIAIEKSGRKMKQKKEATEFVYIVFRQHLCRVNLSKLFRCPANPPSFETLLFFPEKNYPVGMGANCIDSNLYLIGGEKLKEGKHIEFARTFAPPEDLESLSSSVFLFNPSKPYRHRSYAPPMNAPKTGAKSVVVDGKLFVLSGEQCCCREEFRGPRFECYDPVAGNSWTALPEPPFEWDIFYLYLNVIGRWIFAKHSSGLHYYDVDEKEWKSGLEYLSLVPPPFEFDGCMAEFEDGIVIGYTKQGLVAYRDKSLNNPQRILTQLNSDKYFPPPRPGSQMVFIRHLGEGRFCIVLIVSSGGKLPWETHIALFRVKKLQNPVGGGDFVDAVLLRHHLYEGFSTSVGLDFDFPYEVFTMRGHPKEHGLVRS